MNVGSVPDDELRLEVLAGNAAGEKLLIGDRLVFGRQTDGPGRLRGDPELSRHHAEVTRAPGGHFAIEDLASTNGTFVNGVRVEAATVLAKGDLIDLGATRLIVREAPAPAPPPRPSVDVRAATLIVDSPAPAHTDSPAQAPADTPAQAPAHTPAQAPADTPAQAPVVTASSLPLPPTDPGPPTGTTAPEEDQADAIAFAGAANRLELHLVFDLERREAEIALEGGAQRFKLRVEDGRWKLSDRGS